MGPLIIIGCGKDKQLGVHPALDLYTGGHFRLARRFALSATTRDRIWIASALYGLVHADRHIAAYDKRIGQPGWIGVRRIAEQAAEYGLNAEAHAIVAAGSDYYRIVRAAIPAAQWLFAGLPDKRLGFQRRLLKRLSERNEARGAP